MLSLHNTKDSDSISTVVVACNTVKHEWSKLGRYLDVGDATINEIAASKEDLFTNLSSLISAWVKREKPTHRPSWRQLCKALEVMGNGDLAEKIAKEYQCTCKACTG